MQSLIINGGKRLCGSVNIHGAKNSVLPIIAATVLLEGTSVINNCPDISDVSAALGIIGYLGLTYQKNGSSITVESTCPAANRIPDELMRSMRSSVMFLGAILARRKSAVISLPGGCDLGPRPIDIHISSLKKLGAKVKRQNGELLFTAEDGLKGADITLKFPSVGATENIIMAAVLARGKTRIIGAAREPEIGDLANFLSKAGARISGAGTTVITIEGVDKLGGAVHTVIPDRIEAATYMSAAAVTGGSIELNGVNPGHLAAVIDTFKKCGCKTETKEDKLYLSAPGVPLAVDKTVSGVYPAFPTDAGPLFIALMSAAKGRSVFYEKVFKNRYGFINEMAKLGANIRVSGNRAIVNGTDKLIGANVNCTDLRGGAALVIAGLKAQGTTVIGNICHIKRGYDDIAYNLRQLGADIIEE